jgi:ubiquinone/menaquinone biosynthesis C-methylase UbiE
MEPRPPPGSTAARWDETYRSSRPPWDIGRPQPAFVRLADAGEMLAPVLDCGCGTGEHTLMLATQGIEALGVDLAPAAIEMARRKATERGISADFLVGNALDLGSLGRRFRTVIDSGVFHTFSDTERATYVESLDSVVEHGGVVHLLCFSELTPGDYGPRRVTQDEIRNAFATGWDVERIEGERFETLPDFPVRPYAWLARIRRSTLPR